MSILFRRKVLLVSFFALLVSISNSSYATPEQLGKVPRGVGSIGNCIPDFGGVAAKGAVSATNFAVKTVSGVNSSPAVGIMTGGISVIVSIGCGVFSYEIIIPFVKAYLQAEQDFGSPGYPSNTVHYWQCGDGVLIQDFQNGTYEKGALITRGETTQQQYGIFYVGGVFWNIFEQSAQNRYCLGRPINNSHVWNNILIQDFRGGTGSSSSAIITNLQKTRGGMLTNQFWNAYQQANGSVDLEEPIGNSFSWSNGTIHQFKKGWIYIIGNRAQKYVNSKGVWQSIGQI